MTQMAMVFDLDRCVGCESCTVACKRENNVRLGDFWSKVLRIGPTGKFPDLELYWLPVLCQHCKDPQCTQVCPTGASHKREDGIVLIDKDKCIGCKTCIIACPFGHPFFDVQERVTVKCDYCDGIPQCVFFCNVKAVDYVDADRVQMAKKKEVFTRFADAMKVTR